MAGRGWVVRSGAKQASLRPFPCLPPCIHPSPPSFAPDAPAGQQSRPADERACPLACPPASSRQRAIQPACLSARTDEQRRQSRTMCPLLGGVLLLGKAQLLLRRHAGEQSRLAGWMAGRQRRPVENGVAWAKGS